MSAPGPFDPCLEPVERPSLRGGRIRVVQVLATGTNGGACAAAHLSANHITQCTTKSTANGGSTVACRQRER